MINDEDYKTIEFRTEVSTQVLSPTFAAISLNLAQDTDISCTKPF